MPPRKSDYEHNLNGTTCVAEPDAPPLLSGKPRCPRSLPPDVRRIFRTICRELEKRRALTSGDAVIIELLAGAIDKYRRAMDHIRAEGEIVEYMRLDAHGEQVPSVQKNLWLPIAVEAEGKITSLLDRLGLTPLNRVRVKPTKSEADAAITFL